MKLRNKKTGKIYTARSMWFNESIDDLEKTEWNTLKEFCEDWEDYEPKEPLIKDPKIRKAVRAWAEVVGKEETFVVAYNRSYHDCCIYTGSLATTASIDLGVDLNVREGSYTITELCGEEK